DLVGLHSLTLGLTFNSDRADATSASVHYAYGRLWPSFTIDLARALSPRSGLKINGRDTPYDEEDWSGAIGTSLPVLRDVARSATLSFSYRFSYARSLTPFPVPGPDDIPNEVPELGRFASLTMGFAYSDVRSFLRSV